MNAARIVLLALFTACSPSPGGGGGGSGTDASVAELSDASVADSGAPDASREDAGGSLDEDAGTPDAAISMDDAGRRDAAEPDEDAGVPDAAVAPFCGDTVVTAPETCDTAISAGQPGACPTACNDGVACTADSLVGEGCAVQCTFDPISACQDDDGCCPAGCDSGNDNNCSPSCGNGHVDDGEACDTSITAGQPGACPSSCNDGVACTTDMLVGSGCSAQCSFAPVQACSSNDGCCPSGCNANNDNDCSASCGNGVVEGSEQCDTSISDGEGACPASCNDNVACTTDTLVGSGCSAQCSNAPISACQDGDGCCAAGCNQTTDADCSASCGNGVVEAGERCDTAISNDDGACPASCNDNVACTTDTLVGSGCSAQCSFAPVSSCQDGDGCCPSGCHGYNDDDCPVPPAVIISEVLYRVAGADDHVFIELHGPAGADLSGLTLVGVNGADGRDYNSLALTGTIPSDGFFVIVHPSANAALLAHADLTSSKVDFQNAPDSIQLRVGTFVLDAVGYGTFSASEHFAGEGQPAPGAADDQSLGRDALLTDTDDNSADFSLYDVPTPGAANAVPNQPPAAVLTCPQDGRRGVPLPFDASGSSDPDGMITSHAIDFGDGSATATGATVMHAFTAPGSYMVTLTVTDDDGATAQASCMVSVTGPTPVPVVIDSGASFSSAHSSRPFTFQNVPPVSQPGTLSYRWLTGVCSGPATSRMYWQVNGQSREMVNAQSYSSCAYNTESVSVSADTINQARTLAGVINGSVYASDSCAAGVGCSSSNDPLINTIRLTVMVDPPTAVLACPSAVDAGADFTLDASTSQASWGSLQTYRFEIADGSTPVQGTASSLQHRFVAPGTYQVQLTVTDAWGLTETASCSIEARATAQTPADVTGLSITGNNAAVTIDWTTPPGVAGVKIVRKLSAISGPDDGTEVCTNCTPVHVDSGVYQCGTVHYGVYTFDGAGNHSRGVVGSIALDSDSDVLQTAGESHDRYGQAVAVQGNFAVVGAPGEDVFNGNDGAVMIYERTATGWVQRFRHTWDNYYNTPDAMGSSVAMANEFVLVGSPRHGSGGSIHAGTVHILRRGLNGTWSAQGRLGNPNAYVNYDLFGSAIAMTPYVTLVGAPGENTVWTYFQNGGSVFGTANQLPTTGLATWEVQGMGTALAVDGDVAVVGAPGADSEAGRAHVYRRTSNNTWTRVVTLAATGGAAEDRFGAAVAISGNTIIVGAPGRDGARGAVYRFTGDGTTWPSTSSDVITLADGVEQDGFGTSVALAGNTLVVGAPGRFADQGAAFTYTRSGSAFVLDAPLTACGVNAQAELGAAVATDGTTVIVGAPMQHGGSGFWHGAAHVY